MGTAHLWGPHGHSPPVGAPWAQPSCFASVLEADEEACLQAEGEVPTLMVCYCRTLHADMRHCRTLHADMRHCRTLHADMCHCRTLHADMRPTICLLTLNFFHRSLRSTLAPPRLPLGIHSMAAKTCTPPHQLTLGFSTNRCTWPYSSMITTPYLLGSSICKRGAARWQWSKAVGACSALLWGCTAAVTVRLDLDCISTCTSWRCTRSHAQYGAALRMRERPGRAALRPRISMLAFAYEQLCRCKEPT